MPGIDYTLGLDSNPAVAGLSAFKGALGGLAGVLSLVGIGFGAFKGAEAFTDALKGVFEQGKELSTLHNITGQSIGDVVALRKAFSEAGLSSDAVSGDLIRLQKSLGGINDEGQPTAHIFNQLGLSIADLKGQSGVDQLTHIGEAISHLGDQASKTYAVTQIFGREGAELLALFADTHGIDEARESTAAYGAILTRNAGLFKAITNDLEALSNKVKGFFSGFADKIGPVLLPLLDKLKSSINLVGFGQEIGGALADAARTIYGLFSNGSLGEAAGLALRVGFADATNWLSRKLAEIFDAVNKSGPGFLESMKTSFSALKDIFLGLGDIIGGAITKGISASLRDLTIAGIPVTDHGQLNQLNMQGNQLEDQGAARVQAGIAGLGTGGIAGQIGGFFKGLTTPVDDARARLHALADAAVNAAKPLEFFGPTMAELQKHVGGLSLGAGTAPKIEPLSDSLSKIGLFVGGNGGARGEAAQQTTAKNTGLLVSSFAKMGQDFARLHEDLRARHSAVF
jgi:hypothetical protein